jgi:hypothetical protein
VSPERPGNFLTEQYFWTYRTYVSSTNLLTHSPQHKKWPKQEQECYTDSKPHGILIQGFYECASVSKQYWQLWEICLDQYIQSKNYIQLYDKSAGTAMNRERLTTMETFKTMIMFITSLIAYNMLQNYW